MSEPVKRLLCPACQTAHEGVTNFCGKCGYDLRPLSSRGAAVPATSSAGRATSAENLARAETPQPETEQPEIDPWLNRLIDGRYRVLARIGQGGMGIVYKVEHQRMGKIAAMKVLHRDLASDREVVRRFRREAEAVSRLTHPNTVQTFDFGTWDGALYLVMEYVRGEDLGAIVRRDGPLPFRRAAPLFVQICGALAEAHELGIVHRDLKPENILVTRTKGGRDHVKVLDFGLAKLSEREEAAEVTGRGAIVGTPYYMSPEQIRGEPLDHRSDIYSLGATMYRVLTGEPPFEAQSPVGVLTKHLTDEPVPPSLRIDPARAEALGLDSRVDAVVLRAMAKRREDRHASVDSIREDLERLLAEAERDGTALAPPDRGPPGAPGVFTPTSARGAVFPTTTPTRLSRERRGAPDSNAIEPLQREEFDAFERSLRRRMLLRLVFLPVGIATLAAGGWAYLRWTREQPQRVEREPNNDLEHATPVASGTPVRGKIGQRLAEDASDRDYYRIKTGDGMERRKLRATVTPIRNLDLALAVYDGAGKLLAVVDNDGVGGGEVLPNLGVFPGVLYVAVMESKEAEVPTENITDEYQLVVELSAPAPDEELEPNDLDSDATPIAAGRPVHGFLSRHRDVDRYRFAGPAGRYEIRVTGAEAAPVQLRLGDGAATADRTLVAELAPGTVIGVERDDPEVRGREVTPGVDREYTILVRPSSK